MSIITAKNLVKIYQTGANKVKALNNISLEVAQGEFLMITGRNGSGKSTFLHQLALLDMPDSGEIFIGETNTSYFNEKKRSDLRLRHLGYIFQEYALINELSALENVMLPAMMMDSGENSRKRAIKILEKVSMSDKAHRLPSQLSGGEQQRVAIARALINNPKIIFADEPTANLDSLASKSVLGIFNQLNREGITIVIVTHEPEELIYASRHINLVDGRLV